MSEKRLSVGENFVALLPLNHIVQFLLVFISFYHKTIDLKSSRKS